MKAELRAVLDTNVVISAALLADSLPSRVLRRVLQQGRFVVAEPTFNELAKRLWRPKFDRYVSIEHRRQLLDDLAAAAEWVPAAEFDRVRGKTFCRDPSDDRFVHVALAGRVSVIVSGDRDLLALDGIEGIAVLTPAAAWAAWTGAGGDDR